MMEAFGQLLEELSHAASDQAKLVLLGAYFKAAPPVDRGWALAVLTGRLSLPRTGRKSLNQLISTQLDPVLYEIARDYAGNDMEALALIWPQRLRMPAPSLAEAVALLSTTPNNQFTEHLARMLSRSSIRARLALLQLAGNSLKFTVPTRLMREALAHSFAVSPELIMQFWPDEPSAFTAFFDWLLGGAEPSARTALYLRPYLQIAPFSHVTDQEMDTSSLMVEWAWDGRRTQIVADGERARLYDAQGEEISAGFPEIVSGFAQARGVFEGIILGGKHGQIGPLSLVEQRLKRKNPSAKLMAQSPVQLKLYDLLSEGEEDIRSLPLSERRYRLQNWQALAGPELASLSETLTIGNLSELPEIWRAQDGVGRKGLMVKHRDQPYRAEESAGGWFYWQPPRRQCLGVLLYAQRGGELSFGAWDGAAFVPVGKLVAELPEAEEQRLRHWVKEHTIEQFGPVRAVKPELVVEIAFSAVVASKRHKSGLVMQGARLVGIHWEKPVEAAHSLAAFKEHLPLL